MGRKLIREPMDLERLKIAGILADGTNKPPPTGIHWNVQGCKELDHIWRELFWEPSSTVKLLDFWDKKGDIAFQNPFADGELIYTTFKKPVKRIVFRQQGFITDSKDKRYHPTQKPTELVQQLIEMFTEPGQLICDPFLGSGTTAVAAVNTGRHYIGYEIDPGYFQICCDRLDEVEN